MTTMLRRVAPLALFALALCFVPAAYAHIELEATLDTAQETSPLHADTNPNAGGVATLAYEPDTKMLEYSFSVPLHDLTAAPFLAHIHQGARGVAGPIAIPLDPAATGATVGPLTDDQEIALFDGLLYLNYHTAKNGGGEVRGQITLSPALCSCKGANKAGDFRKCVTRELKNLPKEERKSEAAKAIKRVFKKASCGKTKGPKKAIACCLPQTPFANIITGHVCAPIPDKTCTKLGGTNGGASCFPTNPCPVPASPSGAFLYGSGRF